jgi:ketosteroid isomerase-like protein
MTAITGSAQKIANEYARAWLGGDVEKALSFIADDVVAAVASAAGPQVAARKMVRPGE